MTTTSQIQINRLKKEIDNLRNIDVREAKKEAGLVSKYNRIKVAAFRTKNTLVSQSKARELERALTDLAKIREKRANISKKISDKEKKLASFQERQSKEVWRELKRQFDLENRLRRERELNNRRITREVQSYAKKQFTSSETFCPLPKQSNTHDFFISHASEDKEGFVRSLVTVLEAEGAIVWFDEFALRVGDSLRQKFDHGLRDSRFGIVVKSRNFIVKECPQKELDGLVSLEVDGQSRILPIWHEISKDEVIQYSPTLVDKFALNTSNQSTQEIASKLAQLIDKK